MPLESKNPLLPDELVAWFLGGIRKRFYPQQEKLFFQEKGLLTQAITYPAHWLNERAVAVNSDRYKAILVEIIQTVNAHGNLSQIRSPGRYLLHAVQEHMKHHGEDYYEAGKATRNAIEDALEGIRRRSANKADKTLDNTVPVLAETHRVLLATKRAKKAVIQPAKQGELF